MNQERQSDLCEYTKEFPSNTQYLSLYDITPSEMFWLVPKKIKDRMSINTLGVNGLATTIVFPETINRFDITTLKRIGLFSNRVNRNIGLPESDDFIIRTANQNHSRKFSEPAILAKGVGSLNPKFELLTEGNSSKDYNLKDFLSNLLPNTFLLVHDDNYRLQMQSLHGRIGQFAKNSHELLIATGTLHPRNLGEDGAKYPYIRFKADYASDFETLDPFQISAYFKKDQTIKFPKMEVSFSNCDQNEALKMVKKLQRDFLLIAQIAKKVQSVFGSESITEFRSYNILEGGIGQKVHALDVNY